MAVCSEALHLLFSPPQKISFADGVATFLHAELSLFSWEALVFALRTNTNKSAEKNDKSAEKNDKSQGKNDKSQGKSDFPAGRNDGASCSFRCSYHKTKKSVQKTKKSA